MGSRERIRFAFWGGLKIISNLLQALFLSSGLLLLLLFYSRHASYLFYNCHYAGAFLLWIMQYDFTINCTGRLREAAGTSPQVQWASLLPPISTSPGVYKSRRLVVTGQHCAIIWVAVECKHLFIRFPREQRNPPPLQTFFGKDILRNLFQGHLPPLRKEAFRRNTNRPQMVR